MPRASLDSTDNTAHTAQCLLLYSLVRVRRMLSPRGTVSLYSFYGAYADQAILAQGSEESQVGGRLGDDGLPLAALLLLQSEHGAARHEAQDAAHPVGRGGLRVGGECEGAAIAQLQLKGARRPQRDAAHLRPLEALELERL